MKKTFIGLLLFIILTIPVWIGWAKSQPEQKAEPFNYTAPKPDEIPGWKGMRKVQSRVYRDCSIYANLDPRSDYDLRTFDANDYWRDCRENTRYGKEQGDCEDFALAFKNLLIERYPAMKEHVALYFVWVSFEGQLWGHAIAIVDHPEDGERYVFDNRFDELRPLKEKLSHYKTKDGKPALRRIQQQGTKFVFVERANA